MNTASKDLCQELHELAPEWDSDELDHRNYYRDTDNPMKTRPRPYPLYTLGYLLRKLPRYLPDGSGLHIEADGPSDWNIGYFLKDDWTVLVNSKNWYGNHKEVRVPVAGGYKTEHQPYPEQGKHDHIENSACKLAIELIKQGVLS